jgi:hypothetical protein
LLILALHLWGKKKEASLYCPEEGRVLQVSVPSKLHGTRFCGTYDGGWIAATLEPATLTIVNLFSSIEVALPEKQRSMGWQDDHRRRRHLILKIIFSEIPSSNGYILAALTTEHDKMAVCRVGCPDGGCTFHECDGEDFWDAAFHHGELYGLTQEKLFKFDLGVNEDGAPVITAAYPYIQWRNVPMTEYWFNTYIFELHH